MGTSDPRNAATKLGVDRHEAPAADLRTLSLMQMAHVAVASGEGALDDLVMWPSLPALAHPVGVTDVSGRPLFDDRRR
jgi:hypothetical protein